MASNNMTKHAASNLICLLSLVLSLAVSSSATGRILHQPFFPRGSIPPDSCPTPTPTHKAFFPSNHSPPTPPPPIALSTFPANIFSPFSLPPVIAIVVSVSLLSVALLALLALFIYYRNKYTTPPHQVSRSDSLLLYPPNTLTFDAIASHKPPSPSSSFDFLYLGTVVNSREACMGTSAAPYQKLGSLELKPLLLLPRHRNRATGKDDEEEEFYSPRGSSGRRPNPVRVLRRGMDRLGIGSRSFNSAINSASLTSSLCLNLSLGNSLEPLRPMTSSSPSSPYIDWNFPTSKHRKKPPSPLPLPPPCFWETSPNNNEDARKQKLKPLHWDKARASWIGPWFGIT
ncbi:hypothetical protein QN277_007893 [Acacia crassicarpa]|uniref:Uncharacterized protein n=1 Tax=Acacia crassicarpa TaxID=499986 RepID=A0AAE1M651_9FABA|nr:hypothetical protein QN277_007893 [Acacia crassicarpa]